MKKARCPSCKNIIELQEETKVQELITCLNCKSILELVKKFPPTLDWPEDSPVYSSRNISSKNV